MEESKKSPILDALVDLGSAWAAHGLDAGKLSLESSARILTKTAHTLETLARDLESKGGRAAHKPDAHSGV
jgi:hypothetical protein